MPDALKIVGLSHAFGDAPVLHDVELAVARGEIVSVLGRSGCGKTTLLRAVGGFFAPDAGRIALGGRNVSHGPKILVPTEERGLGIVFQDYALFGHMTVAANVAFGLPRAERAGGRVAELLDLVGLSALRERRPAELSGGQQQRVALARAMAPRPSLLLLDEPFANLDTALRLQLREELRAILRRANTAAVLITHDKTEALSIADRVVAMAGSAPEKNSVLQCDTPDVLYLRPADEEVARLTGDVTVLEATASGTTATNALGDWPLSQAHEGAVRLFVRPEQLRFVAGEGPCRVVGRQFLGPAVALRVEGAGMSALLTMPLSEAPPAVDTAGRLEARGPLHALPG